MLGIVGSTINHQPLTTEGHSAASPQPKEIRLTTDGHACPPVAEIDTDGVSGGATCPPWRNLCVARAHGRNSRRNNLEIRKAGKGGGKQPVSRQGAKALRGDGLSMEQHGCLT